MALKQLSRDPQLDDFLRRFGVREPAACAALRAETAAHPRAGMQAGSDVAALLASLIRFSGSRRVIEVGTFTGYSALWMALALPAEGHLLCCDVSDEYTAMARRHWAAAGVSDRITLRLAPATVTLQALLTAGEQGTYDLIFVDADKESYPAYFELGLALLRPGGMLAFDNTLWSGRVADPTETDPVTALLRALDAAIHADPRVEPLLLPISDGLTLAVKR